MTAKRPSTGSTRCSCGEWKSLQARTCLRCRDEHWRVRPIQHGTESGYKHGCRDACCREAARIGRNRRRAAKKAT